MPSSDKTPTPGDFIGPENTLMSDIATPQALAKLRIRAADPVSIRFVDAGRRHASDKHCEGLIMRISARNQIKGTVVEVKKGATTSHIRVDIGNGQIVTSSITNEAVDELGIKAKGHVTVVVKASDVMIGVD
jgi:molybdopterin-binding protein